MKTRGSGLKTCTFPSRGGTVIEAHGNTANIILIKSEQVKRHISGEPPEGFDKPAPTYIPSGTGMPEDAFDPSTEPDINVPEPDLVDPTGGEPEIPPMEPDITPEPDPVIDPDVTSDTEPSVDPEPDKPEPDPGDGEPERPEDFD